MLPILNQFVVNNLHHSFPSINLSRWARSYSQSIVWMSLGGLCVYQIWKSYFKKTDFQATDLPDEGVESRASSPPSISDESRGDIHPINSINLPNPSLHPSIFFATLVVGLDSNTVLCHPDSFHGNDPSHVRIGNQIYQVNFLDSIPPREIAMSSLQFQMYVSELNLVPGGPVKILAHPLYLKSQSPRAIKPLEVEFTDPRETDGLFFTDRQHLLDALNMSSGRVVISKDRCKLPFSDYSGWFNIKLNPAHDLKSETYCPITFSNVDDTALSNIYCKDDPTFTTCERISLSFDVLFLNPYVDEIGIISGLKNQKIPLTPQEDIDCQLQPVNRLSSLHFWRVNEKISCSTSDERDFVVVLSGIKRDDKSYQVALCIPPSDPERGLEITYRLCFSKGTQPPRYSYYS